MDYNGGWILSDIEATPNVSFIRPASSTSSSSWKDIATNYGGNLRIKAYTTNAASNPISSISIQKGANGSIELANHTQLDLKTKLTISPSNTDETVLYSSSNEQVAAIDNNGMITANRPGETVITVRGRSGAKSDSVTIKVPLSIPAESFSLIQHTASVQVGKTTMLSATVLPANSDDYAALWASSDTNIARIASDGTISGISEGTCIITAKSLSGKTDTCTLTVVKHASENAEYIFNKLSSKVYKGGSYLITPSTAMNTILNDGDPDDQPTNSKLKWMITDSEGKKDKNGSRVISLNSKGVVKTKGPGTTYITVATADSYDKKTKTYLIKKTIPVFCPSVTSVRFTDSMATLAPLGTLDLKAKLVYNQGGSEPFNKDGMKLTWASSNKKIVSVSSKGLVKVSKKATPGTYLITVKAVGGVMKGKTVPEGTYTIQID